MPAEPPSHPAPNHMQGKLADQSRFSGGRCADIAAFLAQVCVVRGPAPDGWAYAGSEDLLLREGQVFDRKVLPRGLRHGLAKQCFFNAAEIVKKQPDRYAYCEGFANPGSIIPVHHAWVMDLRDGIAIEVTWDDDLFSGTGPRYIGVPVSTQFALEAVERSGAVLTDSEGGFPVLRGAVPRDRWLHPLAVARTSSLPDVTHEDDGVPSALKAF